MKEIIFKKLSGENFKCHEKIDFDFENNRLVAIVGNNGSGKTSILDSLFWCLTDETMSGRTGDSVIRKKTGKNCSVILEFDVVESGEKNSYIVENYRKHKSKSDLKLIYKNGEKILGDNPSRKDANAFIEQIISPKDILLNCLVLSQFVKNNFIDMNHSGQKGILDTILQLDQYDTYLEKVKDNIKIIESNISAIELEDASSKAKIETLKEYINNEKSLITNFVQDEKIRIDILTTDMIEFEKEILRLVNV
jgi:DNA repair exonuclease SbcCD ATPase subunit